MPRTKNAQPSFVNQHNITKEDALNILDMLPTGVEPVPAAWKAAILPLDHGSLLMTESGP